MDDALQSLCRDVMNSGFWAFIDDEPCETSSWSQRVVCASRKRPAGGYTGTSFWVAQPSIGEWIAGSWSGRMYRALGDDSVHPFCVDWLSHPEPDGCYDVPADLRERCGLVETE